MAHETQITGALSEITAKRALMALGWETAQPDIAEVYDLVARDPISREWKTIQVKTLRVREDRDNALVIYGRKGNGQPYSPAECDYIIGVDGQRAFMFECTGQAEYWATETSASKRWIELTATKNEAEAV